MFDHPKYIIVEDNGGPPVAIIFNPMIDHIKMAQPFAKWNEEQKTRNDYSNVVGAGFCSINEEKKTITGYGKSVTLGIKSREEDSDILTKTFIYNY